MKSLHQTISAGLGAMLLAGAFHLSAATDHAVSPPRETRARHDARMAWWRRARFGMFIHWGLYAIPAGTWHGKRIPGLGEWIMNSANIPVKEYEKLAKRFDPVKFDAARWVRIAKDAGVKYIVITSKHHDGFCMFRTKATPYNIVDATPYHKDVLAALSRECRKQGIHFCTYYSIMDWHHPAQYRASPTHYNPTRMHAGKKAEYIAYVKRELKELLDQYDPDVLWFDGEWPNWYTEKDGQEIYSFLRRLKPSLIINNRVGKGRQGMKGLNKSDQTYVGDFGTPEQQIPATGLPGVDWESCMTMNDTWGYKSYDHHWKSAKTLIRNLIDIASKGGNYLLNVGPTAKGVIPAASVKRLKRIGRWMHINGQSIYGTRASPFPKITWGRCTQKDLGNGHTRLYFQVFDWPQNGRLRLPGFSNRPLRAFLLEGHQPVAMDKSDRGLVLHVPEQAPDSVASVVVVDIEGKPRAITL